MGSDEAQIISQYIGACFGLAMGIGALLLPWRFNPFRPKGLAAAAIPEKLARRLPRFIALPVIATCLLVLVLTPILGPMPW
jgi:hypothetical protein